MPVTSLRNLDIFRNAPPEMAEQVARIYAEVLQDPEISQLLAQEGINPNSLLDAPMTARGVTAQRALEEQRAGGLLGGMQRGAADFLDQFGLARPLGAVTGGFEGLEPSPVGTLTNIAGFQVEPARFLTNVGASLIPFVRAAKLATPVFGGITSPLLRGSLTYGSAFGGLEVARQAGRALSEGEGFSIPRILSETAIGAASGFPTGGGLVGRLQSAALTGGTAAATSALPGVEFEPSRVATEALFAALFPATELPHVPLGGSVLSQKELLAREADRIANMPREAVRQATNSRLAQLSDDDLINMIKSGTADDAIIDQLFQTRGQLTSSVLRARAAAVDELSGLPDEFLNNIINRGGIEAQFAADALAMKQRATRPVDAPPVDPIEPKNTALAIRETREQARIQAENEALSVIAERTMPLRERVQPELEKLKSRVEEAQSTPEALAETVVNPPVRAAKPPKIRVGYTDQIRSILYPEYQLRLKNADNVIGEVRGRFDLLEPADRNRLLDAAQEKSRMEAKLADTLDFNRPIEMDASEAFFVTDQLTQGMSARELKNFRENLPNELYGFERVIDPLINRKTGRKAPRDVVAPVERAIANLRDIGILSSRAGDIPIARALNPQNLTLKKVRLLARMVGGDIQPVEGGIQFSLKGQTMTLKSLKRVVDQIEKFAKGVIDDPLTLDEAAARRGMSAIHTGDGQYRIVDHVEGTVTDVDNPEAAMAAVREVPARDADAPELATPGPYRVNGEAVSGRQYRSQAREPVAMVEIDEYRKPTGKLSTTEREAIRQLPLSLGKFLQTTKDGMIRIQETFQDFPVFTSLFEPMTKVSALRSNFVQPHMRSLRKALRNVKGERMGAVQEAFLARGNTREVVANFHNLTGLERRAVERLEEWYGSLLGLNEQGVSEVQEGISAFRRSAGDPRRALGDFKVPRVFEQIRDGIENGKVRLDQARADEVATSVLHELANERFRINELVKRGDSMLDAFEARLNQVGRTSDEGKSIQAAQSLLRHYLNVTTDRSDLSARVFRDNLNNIIVPSLQRLGKLFGDERKFVKKDFFSKADAEKLANLFTTWYSGIAMSGRMALATRNLFQSLLIAPKLGLGRTMGGIKKALKPAEWKAAREAGVISENSGLFLFDELEQINEGLLRTLQRLGLTPYRGADSFNRVVSFTAGRDAVKEAAPTFLKNPEENINWFLLQTGLAGESNLIQKTVLSKLRNRSVDEAAEFYGRHLAQESQYLYSRNNVPEYMTGTWGRLFGQFGVWPIGFVNYMRRNTGGMFSADPVRRAYSLQFFGKYVTLWSTLAALGVATGVDTTSWNFASPFAFEGGPALQILKDVSNIPAAGSEFQRQMAISNLKRAASELFIPFGGLVTDLRQAGEEQESVRRVLTALGFNLTE